MSSESKARKKIKSAEIEAKTFKLSRHSKLIETLFDILRPLLFKNSNWRWQTSRLFTRATDSLLRYAAY